MSATHSKFIYYNNLLCFCIGNFIVIDIAFIIFNYVLLLYMNIWNKLVESLFLQYGLYSKFNDNSTTLSFLYLKETFAFLLVSVFNYLLLTGFCTFKF